MTTSPAPLTPDNSTTCFQPITGSVAPDLGGIVAATHAAVAAERDRLEKTTGPDLARVVADLNFNDPYGSRAELETYKDAFAKPADFYNAANTALFVVRERVRGLVEDMFAPSVADVEELVCLLNTGLAHDYADRFGRVTADRDDLRAAAYMGLVEAIGSYDPSRGRFSSWAYRPIRREVLKCVRDLDHQHLSHGDFEVRSKVLAAAAAGDDLSEAQVAAVTGQPVEVVARILNPVSRVSIDKTFGDGAGTVTLADLLPDQRAAVDDQVVASFEAGEWARRMNVRLDGRERLAVSLRLGDGSTYTDIGKVLGLSREGARNLVIDAALRMTSDYDLMDDQLLLFDL